MKQQIHGGDVYRHKQVIDFSSNTNPLGPPEGVIRAAAESLHEIEHYPDINCTELTAALAVFEQVPESFIVCGNGAADLIFSLVQAEKPRTALLLAPTFAEYEQALQTVGCAVQYHFLKESEGFHLREDILEELEKAPDMLFLCNPNNPTGIPTEPELMARIMDICERKGIRFVLDECFNDFLADPERYTMKGRLSDYHQTFLLKAFTKRYAMAGLRLGYGLSADAALLGGMQQMTQPWNVSIPAQAAGVAALRETEYVQRSMELVRQQRESLVRALQKLGLVVYDSQANYVFFRGPEDLYEVCLEKGFLIRDCGNYPGLKKGYFRIAVKKPEENEALLQALAQRMIH